jgi:hypothetical protein
MPNLVEWMSRLQGAIATRFNRMSREEVAALLLKLWCKSEAMARAGKSADCRLAAGLGPERTHYGDQPLACDRAAHGHHA